MTLCTYCLVQGGEEEGERQGDGDVVVVVVVVALRGLQRDGR